MKRRFTGANTVLAFAGFERRYLAAWRPVGTGGIQLALRPWSIEFTFRCARADRMSGSENR